MAAEALKGLRAVGVLRYRFGTILPCHLVRTVSFSEP